MKRFTYLCTVTAIVLSIALVASWLMTALWPVHAAVPTTSAQLPAGFAITPIVTGLRNPTGMAFLPSGDIFVLEKGEGANLSGQSQVRLVRNGLLETQPVLSLSTTITQEAGLTAVVLDPNFVVNHHFYLWYTISPSTPGWTGLPTNRLSRFTFDPHGGVALPTSEVVILADEPGGYHHHGGGLAFGADGYLYIGTGDRQLADRPQDLTSLTGKVLRIQPTDQGYRIPQDNPFLAIANARPEIYAYGVRNPFRMTRRNTDGQLLMVDVGELAFEEVNQLLPQANYGWAKREGPCPKGRRSSCTPDPNYVDPVLYYEHPGTLGGAAISALAFYEGNGFPVDYQGNLFFTDFMQQVIHTAVLEQTRFTIKPFAEGIGGIVDLQYFHNQLYYLTFNGELNLIHYINGGNQPPVAHLTADRVVGAPPLQVTFSAAASSDADDVVMEYQWDFGDGALIAGTRNPVITHTYQRDGVYFVRLKAVDIRGGKSNEVLLTINVYSGAMPTIQLFNRTEPARNHYYGGDEWQYTAARATNLQGLDPDTPYLWQVDLLHEQHNHPLIRNQSAISSTIKLSRAIHSNNDSDLRYRFLLTMMTETGQEIIVTRILTPAVTTLLVDSSPVPTAVLLNQMTRVTPYRFTAVVGTEQRLVAQPTILYKEQIGSFDYWYQLADGWPLQAAANEGEIIRDAQVTITAPVTNTRYIAFYTREKPAERLWLPLVRR